MREEGYYWVHNIRTGWYIAYWNTEDSKWSLNGFFGRTKTLGNDEIGPKIELPL